MKPSKETISAVFDAGEQIGFEMSLEEAEHFAAAAYAVDVAPLVEALEFYANPEIYRPHPHGPAFDRRQDLNFKAVAALARAKGKTP